MVDHRPAEAAKRNRQRITRTDARVILCGHTHVAEWREFGRRLVCNPGSCGYAFDGDPGAAWALVTFDLSQAQSSRASTAPADRGAEAEAGAEPGAEAEAEAEADRGAEAGAETDADRGAEAGAETDSEADPYANADPGADADAEPDSPPPARPTGATITVELRRAAYDALPAANEVSARGLPGDVYRAATIRTGRFVR